MVIEPLNLQARKMSSIMSSTQVEPELNIQSFHQCSSLVSIKPNTTNFLLWRSQIIPLLRSLGVLHHLSNEEKPAEELKGGGEGKCLNPNYQRWINNDGLLTSWLLGTIKEDVLGLIDGETAYEIWTSLKE